MIGGNRLIIAGGVLVAISVLCDVVMSQMYPEAINGYIFPVVIILVFFPVLGWFAHFYRWVWRILRFVTILLALPLGMAVAPPIMDVPPDTEWNIMIGVFHYVILIASFAVAFLLIRASLREWGIGN